MDLRALEKWRQMSPEEQIDNWLAVPAAAQEAYINAAHEGPRIIFRTLPTLALNGSTATDRVKLKEALACGDWTKHAGELSRLRVDDDRLSRLIENVVHFRHAKYRWEQSISEPDLDDHWPAYELIATTGRMRPGTKARWKNAGGKLYGGRMIALKRDAVWSRFSLFGHPHPPYDNYAHGLDVEDVDVDEAERLRLILPPS